MGNSFGGTNKQPVDSRKHICILYNGSDSLQKENVRSFRDALNGGLGGKNIKITKFIDVSKEHIDGMQWLSQIRHVLVVCVDQAGNGSIRQVLDKRGIKDGGPQDTMHAKVLSVSFGTEPPQRIMGDILQRVEVDMQRDFCFNFQNLKGIDANDFDNSEVMQALRTTIISAMEDEN
ncbi:uncharacterized protein LOC116295207 [Actinia tenebrosa]|uniref:Uncharacterized protein LOC116295207 n=1 Tax=Actinia tenebrosa TaxID=6105 RepID=A0A6P8HR31_ACTTE|nr:uncharacterized protein LOC116295207 [Actinia tenebrosa]